MSVVRLNHECIGCLLNKYLKKLPENATESEKLSYSKELLKIMYDADEFTSAPELNEQITALQKRFFGVADDYGDIKRHFNALMLSKEEEIFKKITNSDEPLKTAVKYAMLGNYIDFAAMENVDENKLSNMLLNVDGIKLDKTEYENLKCELENAKNLVYLTDNCGEIALDKLLVKSIKKEYPEINVQVIVRGTDVLNDATLVDAKQVKMDEIAPVMGNGSGVAGTCLNKISSAALGKIENADVIIAKGQGNFETLRLCGKNIYYIFMCKCNFFAERFGVPQYSGMLVNDLRLE